MPSRALNVAGDLPYSPQVLRRPCVRCGLRARLAWPWVGGGHRQVLEALILGAGQGAGT